MIYSAKTCSLLLLHVVLGLPAGAGVPLPSLQPLQPQQELSASTSPATALPLHTNATGEDIPDSWKSLDPGNPARPQLFMGESPLSQPSSPCRPSAGSPAASRGCAHGKGTGGHSEGPGDLILVSVCDMHRAQIKSKCF